MKLRFAVVAVLCAAASFVSTSAFADSVKVDYNHQAKFESFHTYSWGSVKVSNELNADRIKRSVGSILQKAGWKEVPSGGQVTVMATDNIHNEQEAETYYNGMGGGWGMGWGWGGWGMPGGGFGDETTTTTNVRKAHVVIDMFDGSSKALLWRGVSRGQLSNNADTNRKRLHQDIQRMFRYFPPKGKG